FALTMDRRWEAARAEYQRVLALDPASPIAKARLNQLNALLAKLEPTRTGAPRGPQVLTTSTAAPRPQPALPFATSSQSTRSPAPRDPALPTAATTVGSPRRPAGMRITVPPHSTAGEAMVDSWWVDDSAAGALPRRQAGFPTGAAKDLPDRPSLHPD